jgi:hypothetical protein
MNIVYYVDDGYAGTNSRPHHVKIDDEELAELETESEKKQFIQDCIEEHFRENVSWHCDIEKYLKPV